ncbi:MAG: DUF503 domain-containing protein [Candidatus Omnitrophica bacterium]|nr:DUF503 domain-containing protein [Candidatus Omnitrophota bacterium]MDX9753706.1 DUF503 domain-containing protein [bacterium]
MTVGILELLLHIPDAGSLKAKRKITLSIKDRIRRRFNVSLAETEGQNTWQTCGLTIAMVASQKTAIEREFAHILNLIDSVPEIEVMDQWVDFL